METQTAPVWTNIINWFTENNRRQVTYFLGNIKITVKFKHKSPSTSEMSITYSNVKNIVLLGFLSHIELQDLYSELQSFKILYSSKFKSRISSSK